jgi:hypothetical protein
MVLDAGIALATMGITALPSLLGFGGQYIANSRAQQVLAQTYNMNTPQGIKNIEAIFQGFQSVKGVDQRGSTLTRNMIARAISNLPMGVQQTFVNYANQKYGNDENVQSIFSTMNAMNQLTQQPESQRQYSMRM